MKKCSVFLFLLVTLAAVGQKEYRIEGKVRNAAGNTVVQLLVWAGNMGKVIGSDTLKDGRFSFRGKLEEVPLRMSVFVEGDSALYGNLSFWVGEPLTKIEGDEPCVALWKVKSKLRQQQEENRFVKNSARITREYERVRFDKEDEYVAEYKDQHSKHPKMKDYPVTRLFDSLSALKAEADLKILEEQAVLSEVGLERLYEHARKLRSPQCPPGLRERVEKLYLRLDPALKTTARVNEIHIYLYPVKICEVGDRLADGLLFDREGGEHHLSDYLGKYILLDFWSRGCGPCLMAQPELEELAEKFRDSLHVISISLEVSEKGWKEAIRDLKGIQLCDFKGEGGLIASYGFDGIPKFVVIGPDGKILDKWTGYGKGIFEARLKKLCKIYDGENK